MSRTLRTSKLLSYCTRFDQSRLFKVIDVCTTQKPVYDFLYTVFQKKTPTYIIGYKMKDSCLILIIFDIKIPDII